ncbi:hypothetical protein Y032_0327g2596 [Ancylostoma ceylanicum]|uniref:Uncharacterized protein n=1 Tax=Ancylostoma ceylanicum TaxID=53326 RepID=A0A016RZQ6_9BILA|nr:hypothetical protein Y032_0327g2596 [Ancylostoma ceylanicum]
MTSNRIDSQLWSAWFFYGADKKPKGAGTQYFIITMAEVVVATWRSTLRHRSTFYRLGTSLPATECNQ